MNSEKDSLGNRMKTYENVTRHFLTRRMPVVIRLDGKSFHTLTKNMKKPFDDDFKYVMEAVTKILCEEVQGCQFAYTQSDEISLLLVDYQTHDTQAWFDNNIQKIVSVSASIATAAFNSWALSKLTILGPAHFDARAFNLPKEEVCNYFIWRQQDATRNSIQSVGQANFSHKELHGLSCDEIQEKLFQEKQINWNDYPVTSKRGSCITRQPWDLCMISRLSSHKIETILISMYI